MASHLRVAPRHVPRFAGRGFCKRRLQQKARGASRTSWPINLAIWLGTLAHLGPPPFRRRRPTNRFEHPEITLG
jgi:hypothetical protein